MKRITFTLSHYQTAETLFALSEAMEIVAANAPNNAARNARLRALDGARSAIAHAVLRSTRDADDRKHS